MKSEETTQAGRDAEDARANLEASLDRLRSRLSPGGMLDEGLSLVRDGGVAQFTRNLGQQAKNNPLPVALVGAGLAWLMLARRDRGSYGYGSDGYDVQRSARSARNGAAATVSGFADSASDAASGFANSASDAASRFADSASGAASRMADGMNAMRDRAGQAYESAAGTAADASNRMYQAADATRHKAARFQRAAGDRLTSLMREQPLLLGALGLALGAAIGCMMPRTEAEDRLMGRASDDLKDRALDTLREQSDKAMQVAERVYDSAMQEGEQAVADAGWTEPARAKSESEESRKPGIADIPS